MPSKARPSAAVAVGAVLCRVAACKYNRHTSDCYNHPELYSTYYHLRYSSLSLCSIFALLLYCYNAYANHSPLTQAVCHQPPTQRVPHRRSNCTSHVRYYGCLEVLGRIFCDHDAAISQCISNVNASAMPVQDNQSTEGHKKHNVWSRPIFSDPTPSQQQVCLPFYSC